MPLMMPQPGTEPAYVFEDREYIASGGFSGSPMMAIANWRSLQAQRRGNGRSYMRNGSTGERKVDADPACSTL